MVLMRREVWSRFWKSGDPFVWLTAGALATSVLMIGGLVGLILVNVVVLLAIKRGLERRSRAGPPAPPSG